jgi:transketolase
MSTRAEQTPRSFEPALTDLTTKTIKGLAMDAVQQANSGHPGMPMGCAALATVLWSEFLVHDPRDPKWFDRDRFVLSAGHGSMLLYALLHLTGYDLPMSELQAFRQWGAKTAGHPEYGHCPGVDVTTGPLGSGVAAGVGMALAERFLAHRYNREGHTIVDHMTYGIVSDGDLMEGIAAEAASLAGHLGLGKLIYLYDDNHISIDGPTDISFTEDVAARFVAYGWHVERVDGLDPAAVRAALAKARVTDKPSLIACRTVIAHGSPNKANSPDSHGAPLGAAEIAATKQAMGWPLEPAFHVPSEVREAFAQQLVVHEGAHGQWQQRLAAYRSAFPELARELEAAIAGELPAAVDEAIAAAFASFPVGSSVATRKAGHKVLSLLAAAHPTFLGGSADLAGSNGVLLPNTPGQSKAHPEGRNLHFGVREHGMAGICNGIALHGGLRVFDATFLVFSDFMRGALRLSALMGLPVAHVFTHDSFWLGEDGPTHQPIEQLASLRAMPNLHVVRPADARETVGAWALAMRRTSGPTALLLTRQNLPVFATTSIEGVARGAYVVWQGEGVASEQLAGIFLASGSEVELAIRAAEQLQREGVAIRVVSMPCWEAFAEQDASYRESVLPRAIGRERRLAIEAGCSLGWARFADHVLAIDHFGASAPAEVLAEKFGFSVAGVLAKWNAR